MSNVFTSFFIVTIISLCTDAEPVVQVTQGWISGTFMNTSHGRLISSFRGIPYAEPPLRELRFRAPVPKKSWEGILNADKLPSICPQIQTPEDIVVGDEDCLFLNVYTPWVPESYFTRMMKTMKSWFLGVESVTYPVMVFIHGGFFIRGNSNSSKYGPGYLLNEDVVLVTLNYRLGILGFMSTGDLASPGNFGLKDQVLALQWVRDNIRAFDGDPNRVTLFGQSAGGACVNLLALSEKSKDLFQKYIIHSGTVLDAWAFRDNVTYSDNVDKVAAEYDCPTENSADMVECMRNLTIEQLVDTDSIFDFKYIFTEATWGPTNEPNFEGAFITDLPQNLIRAGKMKNAPFMSGVVQDEALIITSVLYTSDVLYYTIVTDLSATITLLMSLLESMTLSSSYDLARKIEDYYFGNFSDKNQVIHNFTLFATDAFFIYPQLRTMDILLHEEDREPYYLYSFNYRGTFSWTAEALGDNRNVGVDHQDDLIYLFPAAPEEFNMPNATMNATDIEVLETMVHMWTNFAKYGTPTIPEDTYNWPPYKQARHNLQIGNGSDPRTRISDFYPERMSFWYSIEPYYPYCKNQTT